MFAKTAGRKAVAIKSYYKVILKYFIFFVMLYLFSRGNVSGIRPFGFGTYLALVFSGANILILSPLYIAASFLAVPNINTVICAVAMSIVLMIAQGIHIRAKKQLVMWQLIIYALLGQAGYFYVVIASSQNLLNALLTIVLGLLFMIAAASVFGSVFKHRLKYKLDKAEMAAAGIMLAALAMGLQGIGVYEISLYRIAGVFIVLCLTNSLGLGYGLSAGFMWGLGGAFLLNETAYIAMFCMCALLGALFMDYHRVLAALSAVIAEIVVGYYFEAYVNFSYFSLIAVALGAAVFMCVPLKALNKAGEYIAGSADSYAIRHIINRNREEVSVKLREIARVFSEMQGTFRTMMKGVVAEGEVAQMFSEEIPKKLCTDCKSCDICLNSRSADTMKAFNEIVNSGLKKGRVSLLEIPPYLAGKCGRSSQLLNIVNDLVADYVRYAGNANRLDAAKLLISDQMGGLSDVILALSSDTRQGVGFDISSERRLMEELTYADVIVSETIITRELDKAVVTLIVKTDSIKESVILKIADKILKQKMKVASIEDSAKAGFSVVTLSRAPRFDVAIGIAGINKNNGEVSGDAHSFTRICDDKLMLALCDGMGSGKSAEQISSTAISLIENFYKAGFPTGLILSSVNKLLTLVLEESFSALDIAVIDLNTAMCDFIKFGSPESVIKHKYESCIVEGGNLPMGVVDEIKPVVTSRMLNPYDTVVLATDGITDVFHESNSLMNFVNNTKTINPQSLSAEIVEYAKDMDKQLPHDDMTCLSFRLLPM